MLTPENLREAYQQALKNERKVKDERDITTAVQTFAKTIQDLKAADIDVDFTVITSPVPASFHKKNAGNINYYVYYGMLTVCGHEYRTALCSSNYNGPYIIFCAYHDPQAPNENYFDSRNTIPETFRSYYGIQDKQSLESFQYFVMSIAANTEILGNLVPAFTGPKQAAIKTGVFRQHKNAGPPA